MKLRLMRALISSLACLLAGATYAGGMEDDPIQRLRDYLRIDTINPPGHESRAVDFFAHTLDAEGIPYVRIEPEPGRATLVARLRGGPEPALMLLNHSDVVPADALHWSHDPLSADIADGNLYGRGALDMKGTGIIQFEVFLTLHRDPRPLRRDVLFVVAADEEAGGRLGVGNLVRSRRDLIDNVGWVLTEGAGATRTDGKTSFEIEVTQKAPLWLKVVATGPAGHGAAPPAVYSTTRLIRALAKLADWRFQPQVLPVVDKTFKSLADNATPSKRQQYRDMARALRDPLVASQLQIDTPLLSAITQNTCSITRLEASSKINVIATEASAELDCRLLPGQKVDDFMRQLEQILDDHSLRIEPILTTTNPTSSSIDTELFRTIATVIKDRYPGSTLTPTLSYGFTDSRYFRELGIVSYGFEPAIIPAELGETVHGNDERIPLEGVRQGFHDLLEIVQRVSY